MRKAIRSSLGRMKWLKYVIPLIFQKSCTDKVLCSISYLTEILTKRVLFRHFRKSVKGAVFTGLFGLFSSYKCLILLTFLGNIFRYLRICFLICRNASTARNQFGSNPTRVRIPLSAPKIKDTPCGCPLFLPQIREDSCPPLYCEAMQMGFGHERQGGGSLLTRAVRSAFSIENVSLISVRFTFPLAYQKGTHFVSLYFFAYDVR